MTDTFTIKEVRDEFEEKVKFDRKSRKIHEKLPLQGRHRAVLNYLKDVKNKAILDVGCGYGALVIQMAKRGMANPCVGIDLSPSRIEILKEHAKNNGVLDKIDAKVTKGEPYEIEDESFDVITTTEVMEHAPHKVAFLKDLKRIIKPGGDIIITTPLRGSFSPEIIMSHLLVLFRLRFDFLKEEVLSEKEILDLAEKAELKVKLKTYVGLGKGRIFLVLTK